MRKNTFVRQAHGYLSEASGLFLSNHRKATKKTSFYHHLFLLKNFVLFSPCFYTLTGTIKTNQNENCNYPG